MDDLFLPLDDITVLPKRRIEARVAGVYRAAGGDFISTPVAVLELGYDGIAGDFHHGLTRKSGGREPWYPRGTEMRNNRQVSIVSPIEIAEAAAAMGLDRIEPEWIGANIVLEGVPRLSMLPSGTLLFFSGGVTLKVDGQNHPCRLAGGAIGANFPERDATSLALSFKDAAKRRRGLVAWIEKTGRIESGEEATVQIPEQWLYT